MPVEANTVTVDITAEEPVKNSATNTGAAATDVTTGTSPDSPEGDAKTTDAKGSTNNQGRSFTQEDVDRIVQARLTKERETAERKQKEAQEAAEAEKLKTQGEYQKLYEEAERKRIAAETKASQVERARLIDRIAVELGIPEPLRDRIKGESEEELRADAEQVAKFIAPGKREAPPTESQRRGSSDAVVSEDEVAAIARQMGLPVPK